MIGGYLVLTTLTVLAVAASLVVAIRLRPDGRAELFVSTTMIANFLILCPIYTLGLTNRLHRGTLAWVSGAFFAAVLVAATLPKGPRKTAREVREAAVGLVVMPFEALYQALRARSLTSIAIVLAAGSIGWSAIMSWYCGSWGQWDALWYHEPMIGFAIQNHGFAFVDLPADLQKVNGYPRLVEMSQLWFVVFTDRRLVEVANSIVAPSLILGVYLLARRYVRDRGPVIGMACCLLLYPFVCNLLQTMYVDVHNAVFVVAATHYATKQRLRIADVLLASICLAMAIGSKHMAIPAVAVISVIALARLIWWHGRARTAATFGAIAFGLFFICGVAASTYLRNYWKYHNPLWPDFKYDNEKWNIHWPGSLSWVQAGGPGASSGVSMNIPAGDLLEDLTAIPYSKDRSYFGQDYDYGFALAYLFLPLSALSFFLASTAALGSVCKRIVGWAPWTARADTWNVLLVSLPALAALYTSPALWGARYNIVPYATMMVLVCWLGGRARSRALGEGVAGAATIAAIAMFAWTTRWFYWPSELKALAKISYPEREVTPGKVIDPKIYLARGSAIVAKVGLARERELGPGDIVAFDDSYGGFPALFWNNRYSNQVIYIPAANFAAEAKSKGAKWVYCHYGDGNISIFRSDPDWQEVGTLNVEGWGAMFRRVQRP